MALAGGPRHHGGGALAVLLALVGMGAGAAQADAMSPGRPVKVGCFYFPGWHTADRWVPIKEFGGPTPLLGFYRDSSPLTHDWQIRWATQHGISFWVFDWYYDYKTATVSGHNAALEEGFLKASLRDRMQFALMWCNEERGDPEYTEELLLRLVRTVNERYLKQRNYLRVTPERRAFFVFSRPDRLVQRFGEEGTKALLERMSRAAANPGGFFYVANADPAGADLDRLRRAGFDACTLYCYSSQGMPPDAREAPYDGIIPAAEAVWRRAHEDGSLKAIPTVGTGWDSRPWYGRSGLVRTGVTPSKFARLCRAVRPFVDPELNLALVGTWNEFGEGSHLEPTEERGFAYLDALQSVFSPGARKHRHAVPTRAERSRLIFADVPAFLEREIEAQAGNLVVNGGFERDWGWVYYDETPAELDTRTVHGGKRSLRIPKAKGGAKSRVLAPGVPWPGRWINRIPAETGKAYRVSVWVNGRARVTCALFDKEGNWLRRYQPVAEGGEAGRWQKLESEVVLTDPEAAFLDLEFAAPEGALYVDDAELRSRDSVGSGVPARDAQMGP